MYFTTSSKADDKEESLLLTGKAGVVQVLGGTAGTNGNRFMPAAYLPIKIADILGHAVSIGVSSIRCRISADTSTREALLEKSMVSSISKT